MTNYYIAVSNIYNQEDTLLTLFIKARNEFKRLFNSECDSFEILSYVWSVYNVA